MANKATAIKINGTNTNPLNNISRGRYSTIRISTKETNLFINTISRYFSIA